jgi:hypothetical protein
VRCLFWCWSLACWFLLAARAFAGLSFQGEVAGPNREPLVGVRLTLRTGSEVVAQTYSGPLGRFAVEAPARGRFRLDAERQGYYPAREILIDLEHGVPQLLLTLEPIREQIESIEVRDTPPAIDTGATASVQALSARDLINIPYPNTNDLRSALRTAPGVVRDARGGLHVNGASEEQVAFTLDGFTVNDPLTGRFDSRVSVESVRSVEIVSGNPPAELGKGSGGAMTVETQAGDDHFRPFATNFFPGFENRKGWTLGDWSPRVGLAGPLRAGRTWFSETTDVQYVKTIVRELPSGQDRTTAWRGSSHLHLRHNLTPSHILSGGVLINAYSAARTGLTALDPVETTVDRRTRQWFFHGRDQIFFSHGAALDIGVGVNRTFGREVPQGEGPSLFTAYGKRGNYFIDAARYGERDQVLANLCPAPFTRAGAHQLKLGIDMDRVVYRQEVRRSGFENFNESGRRTMRTVFGGNGRLGESNREASAYAQDSWRPRSGLTVEAGVRGDWDKLLAQWTPSPRLGVAWSPSRSGGSRIYAGYARIADASNLRIFTRPLDQYTLTTYFRPDGGPGRVDALSLFTIANPHLLRPAYNNWFLGGAHAWRWGLLVRADYVRRRGARGFTYRNTVIDSNAPLPAWAAYTGAGRADTIYRLTNERTDAFDSISVTLRQTFHRSYEWSASYTRSRARSNTVVDISVEDPVTIQDNAGPMPWDAPHRFTSWGYLPSPFQNWAIAYLVEARSGFPFSVQSDAGVVGAVNSRRFPVFFEANLHVERKFVFRKHRWAWRVGCNNLTGRINPDTVNAMMGSSRYLQFYGGNGRAFNIRIRWLGRAPA